MSGVISCDTFGSFEVVIYLFSVEHVENELTSGMHKILVNIVHAVVDDDVANSFVFVVLEFLFLFE